MSSFLIGRDFIFEHNSRFFYALTSFTQKGPMAQVNEFTQMNVSKNKRLNKCKIEKFKVHIKQKNGTIS